ncbi:hypothetical protein BHS06_24825 [Myxococcus xanthus]|nr:hypothetical protein BHS06_24825 [Myxococcus xanthus]
MTQKEFSEQQGLRLNWPQSWVFRRRRQRTGKAQAVRLLQVEMSGALQPSTAPLEVVLACGARLRFAAGTDVAVEEGGTRTSEGWGPCRGGERGRGAEEGR